MSIVAHNVEDDTVRTEDVRVIETIDFAELLLSDEVLEGLRKAGFKRPSPIQLKAIPLGRCGLDLIVQAKSGTGKTCVFTVVALEGIDVRSSSSQVLVLAPTREIAIQIASVIQTLGTSMPGLKIGTFIGGTSVEQDKIGAKRCQIVVGTPGRIKQLIELGVLRTYSFRLLVLDEADKLLDGGFTEPINWIYSMLPSNKQILALSATYPEYLAKELTQYMRNPTFIRLNITDPALIGIKQFHQIVPNHHLPNKAFDSKIEAVLNILSCVDFQQCLIFSNMQSRALSLQSLLLDNSWPTVCIAGCLGQKERNFAIEELKSYRCRILISTDLTSRGIDADRVNLVLNLDVPKDHETYLHRIGRAGRFGSYGAAISIVNEGGQDKTLWAVERKCNTHIKKLPDPIPKDLVVRKVEIKLSDVVSTEKILTQPEACMTWHPSPLPSTQDMVSAPPNDISTQIDAKESQVSLSPIGESQNDPKVSLTQIDETQLDPEVSPLTQRDENQLDPTVSLLTQSDETQLDPTVSPLTQREENQLDPTVSPLTQRDENKLDPTVSLLTQSDETQLDPKVSLLESESIQSISLPSKRPSVSQTFSTTTVDEERLCEEESLSENVQIILDNHGHCEAVCKQSVNQNGPGIELDLGLVGESVNQNGPGIELDLGLVGESVNQNGPGIELDLGLVGESVNQNGPGIELDLGLVGESKEMNGHESVINAGAVQDSKPIHAMPNEERSNTVSGGNADTPLEMQNNVTANNSVKNSFQAEEANSESYTRIDKDINSHLPDLLYSKDTDSNLMIRSHESVGDVAMSLINNGPRLNDERREGANSDYCLNGEQVERNVNDIDNLHCETLMNKLVGGRSSYIEEVNELLEITHTIAKETVLPAEKACLDQPKADRGIENTSHPSGELGSGIDKDPQFMQEGEGRSCQHESKFHIKRRTRSFAIVDFFRDREEELMGMLKSNALLSEEDDDIHDEDKQDTVQSVENSVNRTVVNPTSPDTTALGIVEKTCMDCGVIEDTVHNGDDKISLVMDQHIDSMIENEHFLTNCHTKKSEEDDFVPNICESQNMGVDLDHQVITHENPAPFPADSDCNRNNHSSHTGEVTTARESDQEVYTDNPSHSPEGNDNQTSQIAIKLCRGNLSEALQENTSLAMKNSGMLSSLNGLCYFLESEPKKDTVHAIKESFLASHSSRLEMDIRCDGKLSKEVSVQVQSLPADLLEKCSRISEDEISVLSKLKEKLAKNVARMKEERKHLKDNFAENVAKMKHERRTLQSAETMNSTSKEPTQTKSSKGSNAKTKKHLDRRMQRKTENESDNDMFAMWKAAVDSRKKALGESLLPVSSYVETGRSDCISAGRDFGEEQSRLNSASAKVVGDKAFCVIDSRPKIRGKRGRANNGQELSAADKVGLESDSGGMTATRAKPVLEVKFQLDLERGIMTHDTAPVIKGVDAENSQSSFTSSQQIEDKSTEKNSPEMYEIRDTLTCTASTEVKAVDQCDRTKSVDQLNSHGNVTNEKFISQTISSHDISSVSHVSHESSRPIQKPSEAQITQHLSRKGKDVKSSQEANAGMKSVKLILNKAILPKPDNVCVASVAQGCKTSTNVPEDNFDNDQPACVSLPWANNSRDRKSLLIDKPHENYQGEKMTATDKRSVDRKTVSSSKRDQFSEHRAFSHSPSTAKQHKSRYGHHHRHHSLGSQKKAHDCTPSHSSSDSTTSSNHDDDFPKAAEGQGYCHSSVPFGSYPFPSWSSPHYYPPWAWPNVAPVSASPYHLPMPFFNSNFAFVPPVNDCGYPLQQGFQCQSPFFPGMAPGLHLSPHYSYMLQQQQQQQQLAFSANAWPYTAQYIDHMVKFASKNAKKNHRHRGDSQSRVC